MATWTENQESIGVLFLRCFFRHSWDDIGTAAAKGDADKVKAILHSTGLDGHTIIHKTKRFFARIIWDAKEMHWFGHSAMFAATERGHTECIKALATAFKVTEFSSRYVRMAAARGDLETVKFLAPISSPDYNTLFRGLTALTVAAQKNDLECVEALLPHSYQHLDNFAALQSAAKNRNDKLMNLLAKDEVTLKEFIVVAREECDQGTVAYVESYIFKRKHSNNSKLRQSMGI